MQLCHRHPQPEQLSNGINVIVFRFADIHHQLLFGHVVKLRQVEMAHAGFQRTNGFQETFFQRRADAHHLAGGFHLGAQRVGRGGELVKRKARELRYDVIEARLNGGGTAGNRNVLQRHANSNLRRHTRDGIAARLGRQRGGTGHTRVDLDEIILTRIRVERKLHVTTALNF